MLNSHDTQQIEDLIQHAGGVNCEFFSKLVCVACNHFKVGENGVTMAEMETIRRCASLIESIVTGKVKVS